jgi:hypothetical protein
VHAVDVERVVIERRPRPDQTGQHRHRVRVAPEPAQEELHLLVHHRVPRHRAHEFRLLRRRGQFPLEQQVAGLEEVAMGRQLLDRIAAVQQHALVAVDVGDLGLATRRGHEPWVVGEHAGLAVQRTDIDHLRPHAAAHHRELDRLALAVVENSLHV